MTIQYNCVELDFEPYVGSDPRSTGVFVKSGRAEPITGELGKDWWPEGSTRQAYFETQLRRLASHLNCRCIPAHIAWRSGERNQLDKGCIGHSFAGASSFIESVARNSRGEITHVVLRDTGRQN